MDGLIDRLRSPPHKITTVEADSPDIAMHHSTMRVVTEIEPISAIPQFQDLPPAHRSDFTAHFPATRRDVYVGVEPSQI
jgi:hypothetical protein